VTEQRSLLQERVGAVVIGRNEGERLQRCLESLRSSAVSVVYVDSASSDDSVAMARSRGVEVIELDMSIPFTAARARNAGFQRLRQNQPGLGFVQFVDGDCELIDGWLAAAVAFLDQRADVVAVCGRLRERFPERSIYNRLSDHEWDRPPGETEASGGIVMMRSDVLAAVGGFREDLVAGEEPELCQRLRRAGWKVWRLANDMAWHDAAMLRFGQWWMRNKRVGFGYAQAVSLHGGDSERRHWKQLLSPWIWVGVVPAVILAGCWLLGWPALPMLLIYPLQILRVALKSNGDGRSRVMRGAFIYLGKLPEALGQLQFLRKRRRGGSPSTTSFDYKA